MKFTWLLAALGGLAPVCLACSTDSSSDGPDASVTAAGLSAICITTDQVVVGRWQCGDERTVECTSPDGTPVETIYAPPPAPPDGGAVSCDGVIYVVSEPGPFAVGDHTIVIRSGNTTVCSSTLHVTDTVDPLFVTHTVELWPPNHQMHTVTAADCVTVHDACDGDVPAYFTFAAVDEPADMNGSANTEIDMANLTCNAVDVRVERSGTGDGRVYTLGWAAEDAAGHRVEGTCQVVVPHDQGGKGDAVAGAEVKRIDGPVECLPRRD